MSRPASRRGATALEYGVLLSVLFVVVLLATLSLGGAVGAMWNAIAAAWP